MAAGALLIASVGLAVRGAGIGELSDSGTAQLPLPQLRIDLDAADAALLELLPGIGSRRAQQIIDERAARGTFADPSELERIPGIGPITVEGVRPLVRRGEHP